MERVFVEILMMGQNKWSEQDLSFVQKISTDISSKSQEVIVSDSDQQGVLKGSVCNPGPEAPPPSKKGSYEYIRCFGGTLSEECL